MDSCFVDVTVEFLCVAFHNILYYSNIYPKSVFEPRRKYSVVVYKIIHPEIDKYIELCLKTITECLKKDELTRVNLALTDSSYNPITNFIFDFDKKFDYDGTLDAYLVQCEQNMRAFCLRLSSINHNLNKLPEDASFSIFIHTNESTAVSLSMNPSLEDFPMVEVNNTTSFDCIVPLRQFSVRNYNIATYIEQKS